MNGTLIEKIAKAIEVTGISQRALADAASIPESSLRRKLEGVTDFTVPELERLIKALDRPAADILPDSLLGGGR